MLIKLISVLVLVIALLGCVESHQNKVVTIDSLLLFESDIKLPIVNSSSAIAVAIGNEDFVNELRQLEAKGFTEWRVSSLKEADLWKVSFKSSSYIPSVECIVKLTNQGELYEKGCSFNK